MAQIRLNYFMTSKQSLGGQATAKISRAAALEAYYQNPSVCKQCGKVIFVTESQKVKEVKRKEFCNSSCSALFNNSKRPRKEPKPKTIKLPKVNVEAVDTQDTRTKEELFSSLKNWQSARSHIQKRARRAFSKSDTPKQCSVCGYSTHYEVCHLRPVSMFPKTATLGQINHLSNLVALCPTHHWEFDKGLLKLGSESQN